MPARRTAPSPPRKKANPSEPGGLTPGQIADRLHQTACQSLTGARLLLNAVGHGLPREAAELRKLVKNVDAALEESCIDLRALITELRTASEKDSAA